MVREPLLHFFVLGVLILGAGAWLDARNAVLEASKSELETRFRAETGREPTAAELLEVRERWAGEEALYREALRLGLDRDDPVVRGRLVEKARYLMARVSGTPEPTEDDLRAHLAAFPERFARTATTSLDQVFVGKGAGGANPSGTARAQALLAQLRGGADFGSLGDAWPHPRSMERQTPGRLDGVFGAAFVEAIGDLEIGVWLGPVQSSFGWHLVRVRERTPASAPGLEVVKREVRHDWVVEQRLAAEREAVAQVRARFEVTWDE